MKKGLALIVFGLVMIALVALGVYYPYDSEHSDWWRYIVSVLANWLPKLIIGGWVGYWLSGLRNEAYRLLLQFYQDPELHDAITEYTEAVRSSGWVMAKKVADKHKQKFKDFDWYVEILIKPALQERFEEEAKKHYHPN